MNTIDKTDVELKAGDIVRVKTPEDFISEFAKKIADRDAVVIWAGPLSHGQFKHDVEVRFLKRNGRGKEFQQIMRKRDLVLKETGGAQ